MPAKRTASRKAAGKPASSSKRLPSAGAKSKGSSAAKRPAPSTTVSAKPDAGAARSGRAPAQRAASAAGSQRAQRWALVTARDLMRTNVTTVAWSAPLSEVERVLSDQGVTGAPVVDEVGRIIGVVSVSDLIEKYSEDPDSRPRRGLGWFHLSTEELDEEDLESFEVPAEAEDTARDIMTAQIFTVPATAGLKEIADTMCRHKVHRVLVEETGRLVGLISTMDVMDGLRA